MSDLFSYNNQKNFKLVLDPEWYNLLRYEIESEYFNQILGKHFCLDVEGGTPLGWDLISK